MSGAESSSRPLTFSVRRLTLLVSGSAFSPRSLTFSVRRVTLLVSGIVSSPRPLTFSVRRVALLVSGIVSSPRPLTRCAPGVRNGSTAAIPFEAPRSMTLSQSKRYAPRVGSDPTAIQPVSTPAVSATSTQSQRRDAKRLGSATPAMPPAFASSSVPQSPWSTSSSHPDPHGDSTITPMPLATALEQLLRSSSAVVSDDLATKPSHTRLPPPFRPPCIVGLPQITSTLRIMPTT